MAFVPIKKTTSAYSKYYPQLQVVSNKIYYVWAEIDDGDKMQIWTAVMNADGTGWIATKRTTSAYSKMYPQLQVVGTKIYYVWREYWGYHDDRLWTAVMNTDGTDFVATQRAIHENNFIEPQLQVVDDKIYYVWCQSDGDAVQIWTAVMNTDGTGWTTTKRTTSAEDHNLYYPQFQVVNDKIYYVYYEYIYGELDRQIFTAIMDIDGSNWVATERVSGFLYVHPQLQVVNGKIYYVWGGGENYYQIWTAVMDIDGSNWVATERTTGAYNKQYPQLQVVDTKIYYIWEAYDDSYKYQIWTAVMDIDGSGFTFIKRTDSVYHKRLPQLQIVNDEIYSIWREYDGSNYQIWVVSLLVTAKSSITTLIDIKLSHPPMGKSSITTSISIKLINASIINVKAVSDSTRTAIKLYGEIKAGTNIIEKGFEYLIQDGEPIEESTGIEVIKEKPDWVEFWEIGEYFAYEYEGNDIDFWDRLYNLKEDTIWWFRAYFKDENDDKYVAEIWMKNVPTMTTSECTNITSISTKGHGELTDIGANIVTKRGFYLIKEFSGSIFDIWEYTWHGFIVLYLNAATLYNPDGTLMSFAYTGRLAKIVGDKNIYGFPLGVYECGIGTGILDSIPSNDVFKVKAFGENQLGRGFGGEVNVDTYPILVDDGGPISPYTKVENIRVMNIPDGYKVTRIGKRWGRTPSCNEGDIYEDGEWNNGDTITLFIADLIPNTKYYFDIYYVLGIEGAGIKTASGKVDIISYISAFLSDGPLKNITGKANISSSVWLWWLWLEYIFDTPDDPDYPDGLPDIETPSPDLIGIDYTTIVKEIKCDITADQSIIDKYGRKRTLTIINNLIQNKEFCVSIRDNYLNRFQVLKLKIDIDYDIPLPFKREDIILLSYGQINYKTDGNGVIEAKADGEGIISGKMSISTKIRKINVRATPKEAILTLELEV